jgi:aspartyl-tRNA(Asn)/glutamyl-tRNA(Gln) amidotransferase subunit A
MDATEVCYLPATEALALFRARELSPVEVLEAQIERAARVEPIINAFSATCFDDARAAAREAARRYADGSARELEGITVAVKETMDVAGQVTTHGSLVHRDDPPAARSHPLVQRLQDAGAIVHARSTSPEFACAWITATRLNGVTRTPWSPEYTSGASSGGSGASLAAGATTLATGSDIGGSIRSPAAACGVVGYKPPYGRNPEASPANLDPYEQVGPLARTVADCALVQNVVSGVHPHDIATLRERVVLPLEPEGIDGFTIAWTLDLGNGFVAPEVEAETRAALAALEAAGARVEEVSLGWGEEVTIAAKAYLDHLFGRSFARGCEQHPDLVCDYTAWYAERAGTCGQEQFLWTFEVAARMYDTVGPLLDRYDALICPTYVTQEIRADAMPWETLTVRGRTMPCDYEPSLMHQWNMLSRLPVLAVPAGIGVNGLPVGVQIIARSYDDARAFRVGAALERQRPWLDTPARRPMLFGPTAR